MQWLGFIVGMLNTPSQYKPKNLNELWQRKP